MAAAGGEGDKNSEPIITCRLIFCALLVSCVLLFLVASHPQWLQPPRLIARATVDSATLSGLTVVSNANASASAAAVVSYHLTVRLNLYNNPGVIANNIYDYDTTDAELRFRDAVIGGAFATNGTTSQSDNFYQRRGGGGKTGDEVVTTLELDYDGRGGVTVGSDVAAELEKEVKSAGTVRLELELDLIAYARLRTRYDGRYGVLNLQRMATILCGMNFPVKPDGGGATLASGDDRCKV
jgi:hypothetical protein